MLLRWRVTSKCTKEKRKKWQLIVWRLERWTVTQVIMHPIMLVFMFTQLLFLLSTLFPKSWIICADTEGKSLPSVCELERLKQQKAFAGLFGFFCSSLPYNCSWHAHRKQIELSVTLWKGRKGAMCGKSLVCLPPPCTRRSRCADMELCGVHTRGC